MRGMVLLLWVYSEDDYLQAVYFVKRRPESIKKDNFHDLVMFGDLSHVPLDHFSALIDTVSSSTYPI